MVIWMDVNSPFCWESALRVQEGTGDLGVSSCWSYWNQKISSKYQDLTTSMSTLRKLKLENPFDGQEWTYLNRGGSIGSFATSTMRMILCFAPELKATPCCDGVYLFKIQRPRILGLHKTLAVVDSKLFSVATMITLSNEKKKKNSSNSTGLFIFEAASGDYKPDVLCRCHFFCCTNRHRCADFPLY